MAHRRVHLGIDYGTSASKIIIRDYGAPGGEHATVLTDEGSYRFSSAVSVSGDMIRLQAPARTNDQKLRVLQSLKMRVAAEVKGNVERYCYAPIEELPAGLSATDLATLTVARLVDRGARAAKTVAGADISLGMTLGVPMSFFTDRTLRKAFLRISRTAWRLWRSGSLSTDTVSVAEARQFLSEAYAFVDSTPIEDDEIRDWIRSEAEAAMWWAFQSPSVPAGPYAKVDIGAGTTNSSVFRIVDQYAHGRLIKERLAFFGAYSGPIGMDAVDEGLAKWKGVPLENRVELRGSEDDLLQDPAAELACAEAIRGIRRAFSTAWMRGFEKYRNSMHETERWREDAQVFVIGGGSLTRAVRAGLREHPQSPSKRLSVKEMESPPDLEFPGTQSVPKEALPFLTVAYGLSNLGLAIPEVRTPDEVDPLPSAENRRIQIDHEDIYTR